MKRWAIFTLSVLLLLGTANATDFSSDNFVIKDPVIEPGAGFATSAGYELWSSLGQEAIGLSEAVSFGLKGGFLYFPAPSATTTPSEPAVSGGGGITLVPAPEKDLKLVALGICDFNNDGSCDIVDLSVMLYHFDQSGSVIAAYDLDKNGRLDIVDVSILFYYWTELT
ncbi:MAG: hypothetical protein HY378_00030 [Candidatus Brennerbacteria bacterium]|nr:hypothetical protein [Candidatus Brennerbacteria bacterium]